MSLNVFGRGSPHSMPRLNFAALALILMALLFSTHSAYAALPSAPVEPCNEPGVATNIDPVGGAIQVRMSYGGVVSNRPASIQRLALAGNRVVDAYCIDSEEPRLSGVDVCLLGDISNTRLAYLIAKYPPVFTDNIEQAARQAAVWHFSNGAQLDLTDPTTKTDPLIDNAVKRRYLDLVAEVDLIDTANLAPTIAIDPPAAVNQLPGQPAHPFTVRVTSGGVPWSGVQVQVSADFGTLNLPAATTDANGEASFVISSNSPGTANITASAAVTVPTALEYVVRDYPTTAQPFGVPSYTTETISITGTKQWLASTPTPTNTPTNTPTATATSTATPTDTPTSTPTPTATDTPTNTPTPTATNTPTDTPTSTPGTTLTPTNTPTATATNTPTNTPTSTPGTTLTPTNTPTATPTSTPTSTLPPPAPPRITLTKVVDQSSIEVWSFVFRLNGGDPRVANQDAPTVVWENLTPGASYVISEDEADAPWAEGDFACAVNGQPVGQVVPNSTITLTVNAGDDVICTKENVDLTGTGLNPTVEPSAGTRLFLPAVTR